MGDKSLSDWPIMKYHGHSKTPEYDEIARESAVTVTINGEQYATIVCTPDDIRQLIMGFLASEGIIRSSDQIEKLTIDEAKGFAYAELSIPVELSGRTERWIGSCCGKSREFYLKQDVGTAKTIYSSVRFSSNMIYRLMDEFDNNAEIHGRTGGVHQAAVASANGIIASAIDIGRHNALDKLYGHLMENRISLKEKCILFSGRISSEVILKISKIGAGILIAKSAPTDLALRLADDLQITAVGFVRKQRMNVYTHGKRVYEESHHDAQFLT
ncbi:formate dehydrogenase accessory sulfurtransferase FdhD [Virgibacillus siamensis]|uniref:formate dehydrogenase accessory sulfurtransferase FdhD n=1 Tax=Virgibacillus siamensis TaxID=480071 RepID=UPI0009856EC5|nr:formate dehydrogenase accessory sulfurtransferase FdhD [Virgibacillus siamensis]